jgi:hypothetical protein
MSNGGSPQQPTPTPARRARRLAAGAAAAAALAAAGAGVVAGGGPAAAEDNTHPAPKAAAWSVKVFGLTDDGRLVRFRSDAPDTTWSHGKVRGLVGDMALVGIDARVQDGRLYGVGDAGGVYTIDTRYQRARATKVSQLTVPLQGMSFGVDFNPAANRLRVVSDTGQNLRHNIDDPAGTPAAGTTVMDGTLSYTPPTAATGVTAVAYTNNDLDPTTATTLFDVDTMLDQVAVQSPANAGSLAPTGKLGVDAGSSAGLDIYSTLAGGVTVGNRALATLDVSARTRLYRVDVLTGRADLIGAFRPGTRVVDLAFPLGQR